MVLWCLQFFEYFQCFKTIFRRFCIDERCYVSQMHLCTGSMIRPHRLFIVCRNFNYISNVALVCRVIVSFISQSVINVSCNNRHPVHWSSLPFSFVALDVGWGCRPKWKLTVYLTFDLRREPLPKVKKFLHNLGRVHPSHK